MAELVDAWDLKSQPSGVPVRFQVRAPQTNQEQSTSSIEIESKATDVFALDSRPIVSFRLNTSSSKLRPKGRGS